MAGVRYLYGAAVQGIQGFIFQTNELKKIVEASEIVEQICTTKFAGALGISYELLQQDPNAILMAAGNIKYIFSDRESCEKFVLNFPKEIVEFAPGITISQSVVQLGDNFSECVDRLETNLRIQRNKPMRSMTLGLIGMARSRETGLPILHRETEIHDNALRTGAITIRLCQKNFGCNVEHEQIAFNIDDITEKNDWIAVIHIDGNGLGQIVQKVGGDSQEFKKFSLNLDLSTVTAANIAFNKVKDAFEFSENKSIPMRPVVLGGDDHTLICRADIAVPYVQAFLSAFEEETEKNLGEMLRKYNVFEGGVEKLTACAGIAFIKSSFPFYYGYHLAEALCSRAKKDAKAPERIQNGLAPSCLMFYKVQDSFIEDYDSIVKRELDTGNGYTFEFGPYYLEEQLERWTIDQLNNCVKQLESEEGNAVKSHLRQWISLLYDNTDAAQQKMERLIALLKNTERGQSLIAALGLEKFRSPSERIAFYDVLSLLSILKQKTKL